MATDRSSRLSARIWRQFWLVVLVAHVFLAVGWWWLEPGGFGIKHPRFWTNTVAPVTGFALTVAALAALRTGSWKALRWLLPIWGAGWAAAAVTRFDYPIGRPARFAFVERDRTFRVVEASTGEKGPFRTLARGRLGPEESLAITLIDEGRTKGRVVLADWAFQADTTLSPTAGWGVPVNAIEFSLSDDAPTSPASVFVTLAGTSVGRGWDCVGHAHGCYRNRIRCEPAAARRPD